MDSRVEHPYIPWEDGLWYGPCRECGQPSEQHRKRSKRPRRKTNPDKYQTDKERTTYIGIDGEGQGRVDHRYVLLAASNEDATKVWTVEPLQGTDRLTTEQCLDFILSLPTRRTKIFSFSFNYDITKIIEGLPNQTIFTLMRPELKHRKGKFGPKPVKWGEYSLNLQGTKFSVQRGKKRVVIWDLFKFFQAKFVEALKDWKVGSPELLERMTLMKDKRSEFDKETIDDVRAYCLSECQCIAELAHKLIQAHEEAEIPLRTYYGAGSSGAAMLNAMGIKEKLAPTPDAMKLAVACAFSGGRFENSTLGPIPEYLHSFDISSAYPYQLAFLPCLQHGSWTHTKRRKDLEKVQSQQGGLIKYGLGPNSRVESWGPFPFRERTGTISYPIESGGGWVWLDEYLQGEKLFSNVYFKEAWIYEQNCNCKPFSRIPEFYNLRQKIGKEAKGITIKLGVNSCYGKLAQSVGNAMYQSWIWAGMITSGCRAQILQMLGLHKDWSNLLMVATDGIYSRERINPPEPLPTKTEAYGKPLGGWEYKEIPNGVFVARPGIYFPLEPTKEEIKKIRARGVGRSVILESWRTVVEAWAKHGIHATAEIANVSRFCGAKTSVSVSEKSSTFKRANGTDGDPNYGQWISRPVNMTFHPLPKRSGVNPDGKTLTLRRYPLDLESEPYRKAKHSQSDDALEMSQAYQELMEQPNADIIDYD